MNLVSLVVDFTGVITVCQVLVHVFMSSLVSESGLSSTSPAAMRRRSGHSNCCCFTTIQGVVSQPRNRICLIVEISYACLPDRCCKLSQKTLARPFSSIFFQVQAILDFALDPVACCSWPDTKLVCGLRSNLCSSLK